MTIATLEAIAGWHRDQARLLAAASHLHAEYGWERAAQPSLEEAARHQAWAEQLDGVLETLRATHPLVMTDGQPVQGQLR